MLLAHAHVTMCVNRAEDFTRVKPAALFTCVVTRARVYNIDTCFLDPLAEDPQSVAQGSGRSLLLRSGSLQDLLGAAPVPQPSVRPLLRPVPDQHPLPGGGQP